MEELQTDIAALRTENNIPTVKVNDYNVRVENMEEDYIQTEITVSALSKHVHELENKKQMAVV